MDPREPFAAFEGRWVGRWGDMNVAHLWLTIQPGVQLVALVDGDVRKRGINLLDDDVLCGLVIAPDGSERVHRGWFATVAGGRPSRLVWSTPSRIYHERVACDDGRRTYEIEETILERGRFRRGTVARYRAPSRADFMPATGPVRPARP